MSTTLPGTGLINLTVPTPGGDSNVWDTILNDNSLTEAARVMYAAREDRNLSVRGGGKISWDSTTGDVTFTEDIVIHDHITDKTVTITTAASPTNLASSNRIGYIVKNREPASNQSITSITTAAAGALTDGVGDNGNIVIFHRTSDGTLLIPWLRREILSGDFFVPRTGYSFLEWKAAHGRPGFTSVSADTSQLVVPASSTKPAAVLIDGKIYANITDRTLDLDTAGRNGLDTGAKAASTVYYLYAITPISGFTFDLVCSVSDPDTGPTGFSSWSWLGSFVTIGASAIPKFQYFNGIYSTNDANNDVSCSETSLTSKTLVISSKAKEVWGRGTWSAINAAGDDMQIGNNSTTSLNRSNAGTVTVTNSDIIFIAMPIITPQTIWMQVTSVSDTAVFRPLRWIEHLLEYK